MTNLKLVTTETFGNVPCDFYRNVNDGSIFFTRNQIGAALQYSQPDDAISKIHSRHKARLDQFSTMVKLPGTDEKEYETCLYTERGMLEICLLSRQPLANNFIDWYWDTKCKKKTNIEENHMNSVEINNIQLSIKEINNNRVVTFKDIDRVHERPDGTASNAFKRNRKRFIENEDYYHITRDTPLDVRRPLGLETLPPKGVMLITESGYLMISKVFDDDLAWEVQRRLVNNYFRFKKHKEFEENILNQTLNTLNTTLSIMQEELKQLQKERVNLSIAAKKVNGNTTPSLFSRSMFPKYRAIEDYFGYSRKELYHKLYLTIQRFYSIDLNKVKETYCMENGLQDCFLMDAIESRKDLREKLEYVVQKIIKKWGIDYEEDDCEGYFELEI